VGTVFDAEQVARNQSKKICRRESFETSAIKDWERSFVHEAFLSPQAFSPFLICVIFNTNGRLTVEYTASLSDNQSLHHTSL